ncbi:cell cycle regulatory protein [Rhodotorula toruloides]|uniref:Cell cycle regulatory protein n=1 Tax=Rhodotorula toruloides TaxID=5286 RepID=A0A511KDB1_RHOTO|nr:cell cycle regulatory protein [Rhodotorula toruloides]
MQSDFARRVRSGTTSHGGAEWSGSGSTTPVGSSRKPPFRESSIGSGGAYAGSGGSPSKKRIYGDRFIPNRDGLDLATSFSLLPSSASSSGSGTPTSPSKGKRKAAGADGDAQTEEANRTFDSLLRTELFGPSSLDQAPLLRSPSSTRTTQNTAATSPNRSPSFSKPIFSFSSPTRKRVARDGADRGLDSPTHERYSLSPVRQESQRLLLSPRKPIRQVSKVPFKVLDAPELADDYYLNLVDWSSTNVLGVGLGSAVYTWSAQTSEVKKLCDLSEFDPPDSITSLSWVQRGNQVAVGSKSGMIQIWDANVGRCIRKMSGHSARVGALAWNDHILTSGSHDRLILHRDVRIKDHWTHKLATPLHRFTEHVAAVKAIAWNPHQHGVLASGGGTADQKLRFWNTMTGNLLQEVDTGSQVCNMLFSKTSNELVTTHGFSAGQAQNQVVIWRYPSMQQVAQLTGHTFRVLYLASSPDGQTIVSGAGDETLRFWNAFPKSKVERKVDTSVLSPFGRIR